MNDRYQQRIVRYWAGVELLVTGLLVLPPVAAAFIGLLTTVNSALGGAPRAEAIGGLTLLFACLTGALGVLWATVRLARPRRGLGLLDAAGRAWVGLLIGYFVWARGVPAIFLLFVLTAWGGAGHQAMALWRRTARQEPAR